MKIAITGTAEVRGKDHPELTADGNLRACATVALDGAEFTVELDGFEFHITIEHDPNGAET